LKKGKETATNPAVQLNVLAGSKDDEWTEARSRRTKNDQRQGLRSQWDVCPPDWNKGTKPSSSSTGSPPKEGVTPPPTRLPDNSSSGFFFLAGKYGGKTSGWCICNQPPTTCSPSVFCSQKKEPCSSSPHQIPNSSSTILPPYLKGHSQE
jgi:hypothetical protein